MPLRSPVLAVLLAALLPTAIAAALTPAQTIVVANSASEDSVALARLYMQGRQIPARNLVLVETSTTLEVTREAYQRQIVQPLRTALVERGLADSARALCLIYGMPLKVLGPGQPQGPDAQAQDATVDSELAMLWYDGYNLAGFLPNPLHWQESRRLREPPPHPILMTARLDGPSRADVRRMIRSTLQAEEQGLRGSFYIDAGGPFPTYDQYLRALHQLLTQKASIPSVLDERPSVFQRGQAPQAAAYVGWHSPGRYVPAFSWVPGAVGWHIASAEAANLRDPQSQDWCVQMIQGGVVATIGATAEPFQTFPRPDEFFPLLLTGRYTLAECYWRTVPAVSWRLTLIGDPLYNPFRQRPALQVEDLPERNLAPPRPER